MIARLIEALRALDPPLTAEELADALWLAEHLHAGRSGDPPGAQTGTAVPEPGSTDQAARSPVPEKPAADRGDVTRDAPPVPQAGLYLPTKGSAASELIRSPAIPAIPHPLRLARALRPLRVAASAPHRKVLHEGATAHRFAETGVWEPVALPSPERWLDLALVVDTSVSMTVWQRTIDELRSVLEQLGAFRDVRIWRVNTDDGQLLLGSGTAPSTRLGRSPGELIDPTRRRVVLVVSDCVGAGWRDGRFAALLERWGKAGPVAIMQPLPQRLWWRCGPAFEPVRFNAATAGLANTGLSVRAREENGLLPQGLAVPVLELEPRWLFPWAQMVGAGGLDINGVALFTGRPAKTPATEPTDDDFSSLERVMRFRAASSPMAFRLAGYLAVAPLRLPIMRLVQQAMLPESTPAHLAEVFLGDLLRRVGPATGPDAETVEYEFRGTVRDVLLSGLRRGETLQVFREVWHVVRERLGSSLDFPALLAAIEHDPGGLPPDQQFAQVAAQVLTRLGGRYGELAKQLTALQTGPPPPVGDPSPEPAESVLWGHVPPRNPHFTGRDDLLRTIREKLGEAMTVLLPHPLLGSGGEGKSQLAVEYAYRYADYDLVWWIPAEQKTSAYSSLAALAQRLGMPLSDDIKGTVESVLRVLQSGGLRSRWLLIYDNAADPAELAHLVPAVPDPGGAARLPGHVLITSRDRRWNGVAATLEVAAFTRPESIALLQRRVPRLTEAQADPLAAAVDDLPLAVEQAAAWQSVTDGTVEEYLELLDRRLAELSDKGFPADLPKTLAASLELTFEQLSLASPAAGRLLELCAHFGPEPVAGRLLSYPDRSRLPESLDQVIPAEGLLRETMRDISRFSLARFDEETGSLQVHRLVRVLLQTRLSPEDGARVRGNVHAVLAAATPDEEPDDETTWPHRAEITPHVVPSAVIDGTTAETRRVALDQARFLWLSGDFEGSRLLLEIALERWRDRYGADDELALDAARALANAFRSLGEIRAASDLSEDILNRMRQRFEPDHTSILWAANGFGADLRFRGDFRRAHDLDLDTWSRMRQRYGGSATQTLFAANNVGIDLRLLGQFHEAYAVDSDALASLQRIGLRHRDVFRATHHLARDHHGLGQYQAALRLQRESLEQTHPVLAPDHAFVLQAKMSHASTLRKVGDFEDAERLAAETFEAHVLRFGEEHPNTLTAKQCLAMAYLAAGKGQLARRMSEEALAGYRRVLGDGHPFIRACAIGLGIVLRALGDVQTALETDEATLAALSDGPLGPDHYYTLCCAVGMANDLYLLGEVEAAYGLSSRLAERFRRRLGPEHPYTLACVHNHALICAEAGRAGDGDAGDPVGMLRGILGRDHPEVKAATRGELLECDIEPTPL